jgi:hypothetical protein
MAEKTLLIAFEFKTPVGNEFKKAVRAILATRYAS